MFNRQSVISKISFELKATVSSSPRQTLRTVFHQQSSCGEVKNVTIANKSKDCDENYSKMEDTNNRLFKPEP